MTNHYNNRRKEEHAATCSSMYVNFFLFFRSQMPLFFPFSHMEICICLSTNGTVIYFNFFFLSSILLSTQANILNRRARRQISVATRGDLGRC